VVCPKNHLKTFYIREKLGAELGLEHFKNDSTKGHQVLPLSQGAMKVFVMLEHAAQHYNTCVAGEVATLFYSLSGAPYQAPYFSSIGAGLLSIGQDRHTANTFRHLFATTFRDFSQHPSTHMHGFHVSQLEDAASKLSLNSPDAWDAAYDDSIMCRGMLTILAMWDKFKVFAFRQHIDSISMREVDPLAISMAGLSI
jgi:hypothetical protein